MSNMRDLWYDWLGANTWLFKKINALSVEPIYAGIMQKVTLLGDKRLLPYFLGIIALYFVLSVIVRIATQKGGVKNYVVLWINIFMIMGAGLVSAKVTIDYLKHHFAYPRPYAILSPLEVIKLEEQKPEDAYQSFPSGHVAIVTVLIISLWPILNEKFRVTGVVLTSLVFWSRMALGVHFPMDVISSFVIMLLIMMILKYIIVNITSRIMLQ